MSVVAHHNDWLNLVEVSGPFLALPVLMDALPAGLDKPEGELTADLWRAFTEWSDVDHGGAPDAAVHEVWVRYVIEHVLEYDNDVLVREEDALDAWIVDAPEHDATLVPDFAIRDREDDEGTARLLITIVTPDVSVTDPSETGWAASPAERMESLLKDAGVRLGIVTNGDQWTLVNVAEGENTGFATWYASLWREEPLTLRSFITLLGMRRIFAVAENETLQALLDRSREDQQGVTTQLGKQVRRAIEILIQQIDRVDHDRDGRLLEGMTEERLYESAVTVMMRLIFLFYAEENDLLLLGDDFYDQNYAASTLREQLQATADESGEEILERFHDAWPRLLSTFRAVHSGVEHEQMRLPAYGGALFDPDRYPFLEGREPGTTWLDESADPLPIDNRTVLHLLNAIQTLEVQVPGGGRESRPLSFRALDVEQIGHVYETLLDHTAVRAEDWIFGLEGTRDKEPEVPLGELEARADEQTELVKYLKDETGRSAGALKKRVAAEEKAVYDRWGQRWTPAFQGDEGTARRAAPWGLLVREDSAEYPVVVPPGRVYVTESERRRSSGTHYTPRSLTEEIVTHALEPLVYNEPADGKERSDWELRSPDEILDLKVCDPACGSGAFLVQACRYLAERLVEAWNKHAATDGPDGHALPADPEERLVVARRYVADRCLYGVDINPLATEMAKLSVWLVTLQRSRPFTFLDHAVRTGDSLIGLVSTAEITAPTEQTGQVGIWGQSLESVLEDARDLRCELEAFGVMEPSDAVRKRELLAQSTQLTEVVYLAANLAIGGRLEETGRRQTERRSIRYRVWGVIAGLGSDADMKEAEELARTLLVNPVTGAPHNPFHWAVEYPEVFQRGSPGFDAVIGNPPYLGGHRVSELLGERFNRFLSEEFPPANRTVDQVVYFVRRFAQILREEGCAGVVVNANVVAKSNRAAGIGHLLKAGLQVYRAVPKAEWPSGGALSIVRVWLSARDGMSPVLDGRKVPQINSLLTGLPEDLVDLDAIPESAARACLGVRIMGDLHFRVEREAVERWVESDERNRRVLKFYIGGEHLNGDLRSDHDQYVIDFGEMSLEEAGSYRLPFQHLTDQGAKEYRQSLNEDQYPRAVNKWWQYFHPRHQIREAIAQHDLSRLIGRARVASYHIVDFLPTDAVINDMVVLFLFDDPGALGVIQSNMHEVWAELFSSRLGVQGVLRYTASSAFYTFPMPGAADRKAIDDVAEEYVVARNRVRDEHGGDLTRAYRLFHDPDKDSGLIGQWRNVAEEMERAVHGSFGLNDINPSMGFRETEFGIRYRMSSPELETALRRLAELNKARVEGSTN